ncbi:MAG: DUF3047 domain-containing protein [Gammaproteobacteria bacterium]|nr:DUF3047 domain-containing protein [Gammaproteobacteria bacterium]
MTSQYQWFPSQGVRTLLLFICCSITIACAVVKPQVVPATASAESDLALLRVPRIVQQRWQELVLRGRTEYSIAMIDQRLVVRAEGRDSASALLREVEIDVSACHELVWSWRVDQLQEAADIRVKAKEDVAASVLLLFGDPGMLASPDPVPTLRYAWTNDRVAEETIVDNPYLPGVVRSLVVRSGDELLGQWLVERRNMHDDFVKAFGHAPDEQLYAVALFTDNDQTKQPVQAYYEWIDIRCKGD